MKRKLYELAGADPNFRFSPFCWRTKLALAHKNLPYDTVVWRFTDKEAIAFSGQEKVPVLVDGKTVVSDSQVIAAYLEDHYPNEASLFGEPQTKALTLFVKNYSEAVLQPALARILAPAIFKRLAPQDQDYFRATREARLGGTMEELAARLESFLPLAQTALAPLQKTLEEQEFFAGEAPAYADHILFGTLQWAALTAPVPLWEPDGVIAAWMRAVLEAYDLA